MAGISTTLTFPEMDVTVDIGECTAAALRTSVVALTHGHVDHLGGLPMYLGVRRLYGMPDPVIVAPPGTVTGVGEFIESLGRLQGRPFGVTILPAPAPGQILDIGRNRVLRTFAVDHGVESCGYVICRRAQHLKPEYVGLPGSVIADLRRRTPGILKEVDIPLVGVTGDTTASWIESADEFVINARVMFMECTFLGHGRTSESARKGLHSHLDDLVDVIGRLKSRAIVLYHFSQYYRPEEVSGIVGATLPAEMAAKVHLFNGMDKF